MAKEKTPGYPGDCRSAVVRKLTESANRQGPHMQKQTEINKKMRVEKMRVTARSVMDHCQDNTLLRIKALHQNPSTNAANARKRRREATQNPTPRSQCTAATERGNANNTKSQTSATEAMLRGDANKTESQTLNLKHLRRRRC